MRPELFLASPDKRPILFSSKAGVTGYDWGSVIKTHHDLAPRSYRAIQAA